MKTPCIIAATLLLTLCGAYATAPTGTVTRGVITDTNGSLTLSSTNFISLNGIATTAQLSVATINLTAVSNLTVSGIASTAVARAIADQAQPTNDLTSIIYSNASMFATAAQGTKADQAQPTNDLTSIIYSNASMFATSNQGAKAESAQPTNGVTSIIYSNAGDFATSNQGVKADSAVQTNHSGNVRISGNVALGLSVIPSGYDAISAGKSCLSTGTYSISMGKSSLSGGYASFAFGENCNALGDRSVALGENATASHKNSFVFSDGTVVASSLNEQFSSYFAGGYKFLGGTIEGNGSSLTGITAGQVGAVDANGVTSIIFSNANDFATAAQGVKADQAQPTNSVSWHTNTVVSLVQTNDLGAVTNLVMTDIIYLGLP